MSHGESTRENRIGKGFTLGILFGLLGSYFGNAFLTISHGILLGTYGLAAGNGLMGRRDRECGFLPGIGRIRPSAWCLIGIMGAILLSILANLGTIESPWKVLKKLRYHLVWVLPLVFSGLRGILLSDRWKGWLPWLLIAWYVSIILSTASGMIGHVTGFNPLKMDEQPHVHQVSGIYGTVMTYAYSMQFSFLLLGVLLLERKTVLPYLAQGRRWMLTATLVTFAAAAVGLYFAQARGAMLGIVVGMMALALLYRSKWILSGIVIVGIVAGGIAYQNRLRYFDSLASECVRVSQWNTAIRVFLRYPWFGVGYRQFEERCVTLKQEIGLDHDWFRVEEDKTRVPIHFKGHAHNEYLESFASTGVLGGVFFLGFCGCWCWEVWRGRLARRMFLPVILAFAVSSLVQNMFTDSEVLNFVLLIYFVSQLVLDWQDSEGTATAIVREVGKSAVAMH